MAYKFQLGVARLSGSTTFEESLAGLQTLDITGLSSLDGGLDVNGSNFTVGTDGAVVAASLDVNSGGITEAGAISGASTVSGSDAFSAASFAADGAAVLGGSVTAGTSFIIGSADLNETDLEKLDGITDGTAAANKALVLDASSDVSGINALGIASMASNWTNAGRTVADMGILTTVDINGGSMDGVIIGAASSAVATFSSAKVDDLTQGRLITAGASGELEDQAELTYDDNRSENDGYLSLALSSSASGSTVMGDGILTIADENDDDRFSVDSGKVFSAVAYRGTSVSGSGNFSIGLGSSLILGDASLNEADLEKLDGITDGTAAANKALVLDGSSDVSGVNALGIASMASNWTNAGRTVADMGILTTVDINGGSMDGVIVGAASQAAAEFTSLSASANLSVAGNAAVQGNADIEGFADVKGAFFLTGSAYMHGPIYPRGASDVAVVNNADSILYYDASDLSMRRDSIADFVDNMAGTGLTGNGDGTLSLSSVGSVSSFGDADATMAEGLNYASATLTAPRTLTLPAASTLSNGDVVRVKMAAGVSATNFAKILKGHADDRIDGEEQIFIESPFGAVDLYKVAANTWKVL